MKLVTYTLTQENMPEPKLGAIHSATGRVIDLHVASNRQLPESMLYFLQEGDAALTIARDIVAQDDIELYSYAIDEVKLMAPISNPQKIAAIGRNYAEHAKEGNRKPPEKPMIFAIYPSAIIGPDDTIAWDDALTQQVDFEGELAVVIGQTARKVSEEDALNYVVGYTICNDVSARDLQYSDQQFTRAKSLDTFCPLGPWIVTRDEIPDPQALSLKTILNGEVMQDGTTADMIFNVRYLVSYISRSFSLFPGDIIATGTPSGVGVYRNPPVLMKDGDMVTVEIEGIGSLSNSCKFQK